MRHALGVILLFVLGSAQAATITIDFEGLTVGSFSEIVIDGFRFTEFPNYSNPEIIADTGGNQSLTVGGGGGCGPFGDCGFLSVIMTREDGGAFSYFGADISEGCADEINGSCSNGVAGIKVGGGGALGPVGTGDWVNLESVRFVVSGETTVPGGFQAFSLTADNIVVNAVPIPAAVWLFGSGLGLLGWMKRKRA